MDKVITIQSYIEDLENQGMTGVEISKHLRVSASMISTYKSNRYNISLKQAKLIYKLYGVTIHPYSEASLKAELNLDRENENA
jgi:transcriptional regulator with XRE-family HTH domain